MKWDLEIYNWCESKLSTSHVLVTTTFPTFPMEFDHVARNDKHIPDCLLIYTLAMPHTQITKSILNNNYIVLTDRNGHAWNYIFRPSNVMSSFYATRKKDIIQDFLHHATFGISTAFQDDILYFKFENTYYWQLFPPGNHDSLLQSTIVVESAKTYCFLYNVFQCLNLELNTDTSGIVLSYINHS